MGIHDRTPPLRAAVQSLLLYATLYGVAAGCAGALCLVAWGDDTGVLRRNSVSLLGGAVLAGLWFSAFNSTIQTHVMNETGLRPRDAVRVLHGEYLRRRGR